jgi:peptidoglycan hydrolase-like protein with peptidoglycan-binding domain
LEVIVIRKSVGQGGQNIAGDVLYVQILLADVLVRKGLASISIDGVCGPKTIKAIRDFQQAGPALVQDGRIDPNGPTIRALHRKHIEGIGSGQLVQATYQLGAAVDRVGAGSVQKLAEIYLSTLRAGLG